MSGETKVLSSGKFIYVVAFDQEDVSPAVFDFEITGTNGELTPLSDYPYRLNFGSLNLSGAVMAGGGKVIVTSSPQGTNSYGLSAYPIDEATGMLGEGSEFIEPAYVGGLGVEAGDAAGKFVFAEAAMPSGLNIFVYAVDPKTGAITTCPDLLTWSCLSAKFTATPW
jgi:hypothetical protein